MTQSQIDRIARMTVSECDTAERRILAARDSVLTPPARSELLAALDKRRAELVS